MNTIIKADLIALVQYEDNSFGVVLENVEYGKLQKKKTKTEC